MSEVFVPITGENVESTGDTGGWENGRWRPANHARRASLHDIHLRPSSVQEEPLPAQPVEVPQYAQPYYYEAPQQAATNFTQGDTMAVNHSETLDDLEAIDPYDTEQLGAFIQRQVQAALAPSRQQQHDSELARQYNETVARFGDDGNFRETMNRALEACLVDAKAGRSINIEKQYQAASESANRQPGQRGSHLPTRARSIKDLGKIIDFNNRCGRARPYRS